MAVKIQLRRDTAANWTSANPVLAAGELGVETDTGFVKIGNGSTVWNSLSYFDKDNVGLSNVDNTSDANKPVSTAQQEAINRAAYYFAIVL
jgi:hypothetical protein